MNLADDDPRHGSYNAYSNLGCRCTKCHEAMSAYKRWQYRTRTLPRAVWLKELRARYLSEDATKDGAS